jgi:hypothetical protein
MTLASIITTVSTILLILFLLIIFIGIIVESYCIYKDRELNKYLHRRYLFDKRMNELQEQLNKTNDYK